MLYLIHLATFFGIYAMLGVSLNLLVGFTGLLSVAQAAYFGIGAYAAAILMVKLGINFFLAALCSIVIGAVVGSLMGSIFSRLGGDYYVLGSIAVNYIVLGVFMNWEGLTNGLLGIPGIPRPSLGKFSFESPAAFLLLTLFFLGVLYLIAGRITTSSFGRILKGIREDEEVVKIFGYHTLAFKVTVSGIAAGMAALAGTFFASYIGFIDPSSFEVMESVFILAIVIVGGFANIRGSLVGALVLVLLPELLRFVGLPAEIAANARLGIYGLALVLFMLFRPQGLMGEYKF